MVQAERLLCRRSYRPIPTGEKVKGIAGADSRRDSPAAHTTRRGTGESSRLAERTARE
jgi:hypothetical protein